MTTGIQGGHESTFGMAIADLLWVDNCPIKVEIIGDEMWLDVDEEDWKGRQGVQFITFYLSCA